MKSRVAQIAWLILLVTALAVPAHAVDIRAVRLWAGPDGTRVVLDLSGSAQHSLQVLKNPNRVVLDVVGAKLVKAAPALPAGGGAVKQVHLASKAGGGVRLVLDLARPIQAKS